MQNRIVEWNPSPESNQFVVGNSTKIELLEFQSEKPIIKKYKDIYTHPHAVQSVLCTCLNWHPDQRPNQSIIAYGTSIGEVKALNWSSNIELTIHNPSAASRRVCTSVSWNRHYQRYIAAGFEKSRSLNEFCAVVWDIEHTENVIDPVTNEMMSNTAVIFKPMSDEPISSVCWLSDYNVLAIGTSLSFVRLYDIRIRPTAPVSTVNDVGTSAHSSNASSSTVGSSYGGIAQYTPIQLTPGTNTVTVNVSAEILSLQAHVATRPRKIKGIRQDPFNDYSIATFSDTVLESIKVWDLRKIASNPKPKLVINPYEHSGEISSSNSSIPKVNSSNDTSYTSTMSGNIRHVSYPPGIGMTGGNVGGGMSSTVTVGGRFSNVPSSAYNNSYTNVGIGGNSSVSPLSSSGLAQNACVIDIAWSTSRANLLAVATSHQKCLSFYSTSKVPPDNYTKVPLYTIPVTDSIKCFAWQTSSAYADNKRRSTVSSAPLSGSSVATGMRSSLGTNPSSAHGTSTAAAAGAHDSSNATSIVPTVTLFVYNDFCSTPGGSTSAPVAGKSPPPPSSRHQLLVATQSRYLDIHVVDSVGLSMGPDDSVVASNGTLIRLCRMTKQHIAHGQLGSTEGSTQRPSDPAAATLKPAPVMPNTAPLVVPIIESVMKARCHAGYSIDTGRNLQTLSDELDRFESLLDSTPTAAAATEVSSRAISASLHRQQQGYKNSISTLISVWSWLHRVETLQNEHSHTLHQQRLQQQQQQQPNSEFGGSDVNTSMTSTKSLLLLRTCGILQLIEQQVFSQPGSVLRTGSSSSQTVFHKTLGTTYYLSTYRCLARSICGWTSDVYDKAKSDAPIAGENVVTTGHRSFMNNSNKTTRLPAAAELSPAGTSAGKSTSMSISSSSSYHTEVAEDGLDDEDYELYESDTTSAGLSRPRSSGSNKKSVDTEVKDDIEDDVEEADEELESLLIILHDCAVVGNFERAAALALFNGHLELSVNILQTSYNTISEFKQTFGGANAAKKIEASKTQKPPPLPRLSAPRSKSLSNGFFDISSLHTRFNEDALNMDAGGNEDDEEEEERLIAQCKDMSMEYLHCVSLVAMCLAGYSFPSEQRQQDTATTDNDNNSNNNNNNNNHKTNSMWVSMCHLILSHLSQVSDERQESVCYLTSMCRFLLENIVSVVSSDNSQQLLSEITNSNNTSVGGRNDASKVILSGVYAYSSIILNDSLGLEDRVAFACSFLDDQSLLTWLKSLYKHSSLTGNLRGLIVTGLGTEGMEIIQSYIDKYFDIQTAALIVGRIVDVAITPLSSSTAPTAAVAGDGAKDSDKGIASSSSNNAQSSASTESSILVEVMWLNEYRGLLNRWRYFFARASLDVALGKLFRLNKTRAENSTNSNAKKVVSAVSGRSGGPSAAVGKSSGGSGSANKLVYSLPPHRSLDSPHIALRCHYCSTSLPVDPMQQNQTTLSFLRKQKPVINCCPHCKKQLPRCYVCLLYMGVMNPNTEFNRMMTIRRLNSENAMLMKTSAAADTALSTVNPTISVGGVRVAVAGTVAVVGESVSAEDSFEHNALEYGQWFYFCQRCRHGGHASCIETWFSSSKDSKQTRLQQQCRTAGRSVCGVSGCACKCQYW